MAGSRNKKGKPFPHFESDKDMERFVDTADLSEYDLSEFKPIHFYLKRKDARVNMRMPKGLLDTVKVLALEEQVPYQRLMRDFIERGAEERLAIKERSPRRRKAL